MPICGKSLRVLIALTIVWQSMLPTAACGGEFLGRLKRLISESKYQGTEPKTGQDCAMEQLAENIDWLEHHIDTYGSIVAKQPDIWGEARLTKHRDEFERQMFGELNQFTQNINASIRQSDLSFFAQATALSAAASQTEAPGLPDLANPENLTVSSANIAGAGTGAIGLEPVVVLDQMSRYLNHLHEIRRRNEGDDTSDSPGYALNLVRMPVSLLPGKLTRQGFGGEITVTAEPVLTDDLLPTTFRNLVVNDLVDQLGLPLVRTVESESLQEEIEGLDQADRNIDVLENVLRYWIFFDNNTDREELNSILTPVFEHNATRVIVTRAAEAIVANAYSGKKSPLNTSLTTRGLDARIAGYGTTVELTEEYAADQFAFFATKLIRYGTVRQQSDLDLAKAALINGVVSVGEQLEVLEKSGNYLASTDEEQKDLKDILYTDTGGAIVGTAAAEALKEAYREERSAVTSNAQTAITSSGRSRRARYPIPPTQLVETLGADLFIEASGAFCTAYRGRNVRWAGDARCESSANVAESRVNLLDAQKWLGAELDAACELLSRPDHSQLWYAFAKPESRLANAIRSGHLTEADTENKPLDTVTVEIARRDFFDALHQDKAPRHLLGQRLGEQPSDDETTKPQDAVEALAWAIVVESALLNQRLNEDIRKLAVAKQEHGINPGRELSFFLPDTVNAPGFQDPHLQSEFQQATATFQDYVRVRWPIHVFALDPAAQDQNVADASARRRELQFALALGFTNGQIGGNSLTQFARELQTDVETIGLNRTIVGFGHGSDTFGWRYYPRVQGLDTPGTLGSLRETFLGTGRDYDLRQRRIEPGMRECVAIVLMPSFVPYVDFHIRSNWQKLTNPKNSALTMKETLRLSRAITTMRNNKAQCVKCEHLYRPMELKRMLSRIHQLDNELPLQSTRVQVPYENTLGGFEMFNTGVTDLSPELIGWYGAPGVTVGTAMPFSCPAAAASSSPAAMAAGAINPACTSGCTNVTTNAGSASSGTSSTSMAAAMAAGSGSRPPRETMPADCPTGGGTTLFLVGDNFSVHDTKVIAGGVCIPEVRLVSRDIMRVTIPSCVNQVEVDGQNYVAVYAATPYGVTNHLHIPVHTPPVSSQTRDAISEEITNQLNSRGIPTPPAMVTPEGSTTTLVATATPRPGEEGRYNLTINQDVNVDLAVLSDPRLLNRDVTLYAAVRAGDSFLTDAKVAMNARMFQPRMSGVTLPALGSVYPPATKSLLHSTLEDALEPGLFATGNSIDLRIVYYLTVDGQPIEAASRLREEVRLTVTRPTGAAAASATTNASGATSAASGEAAQSGSGTKEESLPRPQPDSVPNPVQPGSDTRPNGSSTRVPRCDGCGTVQTTTRVTPVQPAAWSEPPASCSPRRLPQVPAQFAQQPATPPTPPAVDFSQLTDRLDRIEAAVQQGLQQPAAVPAPAAAPAPAPAAPEAAPTPTPPPTSTIEVRVVPPVQVEVSREPWWDPAQHPIATQTATRWRERWRNLRDQLPGQ